MDRHGTFIEAFGQFAKQIEFLSKGLGHDTIRPAFHHIVVEPSEKDTERFCAFASDGRHLHIVDPLFCPDSIGLEAGGWRFLRSTSKTAWIAKAMPEKDMNYPNFKKVIPTDEPNFSTDYHSDFIDNKRGGVLLRAVKFINTFPEPTAINPAYLANLGNEVWRVSWFQNNKAVVFESGSYKAVIMPFTE